MTGDKGGKTADNVYNLKGRTRKDFYDLKHGRNKRSVWNIRTQPKKDRHFAIYPQSLVKVMIKAGCPTEVCKECGMPRLKIVERNVTYDRKDKYSRCGCNKGFRKGLVVDPFMGIGTTLKEAYRQQKDFVGFDISEQYFTITKRNIQKLTEIRRIDDFLTKK